MPMPIELKNLFERYNDDRQPMRLEASNIWRWYYLKSVFIGLNKDTGKEVMLFINFDTPVRVGTLEISSPDIRLPRHETKEFNNRFAIVVFSEVPVEGTIELRVHQ
jgi:hypothetical protein